MKYLDLRALCLLVFFWSYMATAAFYTQNSGMVNQATVVTTAAGTTTATASSNQVYIFEGTTTQNFVLPNATLIPLDWWYRVINNSTGTVTVKDSGGSTVLAIGGGRVGEFYLKSRSTSAGTWKNQSSIGTADLSNYYTKSEFISTSSGAADASKPIKTNGSGQIDASLLPAGGASWGLTGNSSTSPGTHFLGTTDAQDLVFKTNSTEVLRLSSAGGIVTQLSSGLIKSSSGTLGLATSGTDYAPATSGSSILKGDGAGGFSDATPGTDYAPATSGSSILKGNGSGGFSNATAGTDYAPATSGSSYLKGNGSGGFTNQAAPIPVTDGGSGTTTQFTLGSAIFAGASGVYSQDNSKYFYDSTNHRLGIGTATPSYSLEIHNNADSYAETPCITNGSSNAYCLYVSPGSVFYLRNYTQALAYLQGNSTGNVGLGGGDVVTAKAVRIKNQAGRTTDVSLAVDKLSSQTGHLQDWNDTDGSTNLASIDATGNATFVDLKITNKTSGVLVTDSSGNVARVAPGSSGNVLSSNGTSWVSSSNSAAATHVARFTCGKGSGDSNTMVLLNFDSATSLYDYGASSPTTWTYSTTCARSTSSPKFGAGKLLCANSGSIDSATNPAAFGSIGTGNFTIEFWVKFTSMGNYGLLSYGDGGARDNGDIGLQWDNGNTRWSFDFKNAGSTSTITGSDPSITTGTWYHFAIMKSSGTCYLFRDGVSKGSGSCTIDLSTNVSGKALTFAYDNGVTQHIDGSMDEIRVSNTARYSTSGFTAPSSAFSITNTIGKDSDSMISTVDGGDQTGFCTVNFAASFFSTEPVCTCSVIDSTSGEQGCYFTANNSASAATIQRRVGGAIADGSVYMNCK